MGMPVSSPTARIPALASLAPAAGPVPGVPVIPRGALGLYEPLPEHHCPIHGRHLGSPREERGQDRDGTGSREGPGEPVGAWGRGAAKPGCSLRVEGEGRFLGKRESQGAAGSRVEPGRAGQSWREAGGGRGAAGGAAAHGAARGPGRPPLPSPAARLRSAPLPSSPPSAAPLPRAGSGSGGSPNPSPRPRPGPARFASARFVASRRLRRARRRRTMPGPRGFCLLALLLLGSPAAPRPGKRGGAGRSGAAAPGPCASRGSGGQDGVWRVGGGGGGNSRPGRG